MLARQAEQAETTVPMSDITVFEPQIERELGKEQSTSQIKSLLNSDHQALEKAAPLVVIGLHHERRPTGDAAQRLAWTWYLLRVSGDQSASKAELREAVLVTKALNLGRLVVKSRPVGAKIFVDDIKWPKATEADGFADEGMRRVRVVVPNLQPAETICEVVRDEITVFSATLGAAGSKADCKGPGVHL
jgi:hypothetical protein